MYMVGWHVIKAKSRNRLVTVSGLRVSFKLCLRFLKLAAQTKSFNYCTVAVDVAVVQIVEQCTALTYQDSQ